MKDTMYDRAKVSSVHFTPVCSTCTNFAWQCMYDNAGETDKEVLLQSALLLSFWHSDRDSHSEPWYWSGELIKSHGNLLLIRCRQVLRSIGAKS